MRKKYVYLYFRLMLAITWLHNVYISPPVHFLAVTPPFPPKSLRPDDYLVSFQTDFISQLIFSTAVRSGGNKAKDQPNISNLNTATSTDIVKAHSHVWRDCIISYMFSPSNTTLSLILSKQTYLAACFLITGTISHLCHVSSQMGFMHISIYIL